MNVKKIKKILLYCIFAIACMFIVNIKADAYTGSDIINVIPSSSWADHYNYVYSDSVPISQQIVNSQLDAMMPTIEQNMANNSIPYYFISIGGISSSSLTYKISYLSNITQFNTISYDTYAFSNTSQEEAQFRASIITLKTQSFVFNNSSNTISSSTSLTTQTSYYNASLVLGMLSTAGHLTLYVPDSFWVKTNIPTSSINAMKFVPNTYYTYPTLKINEQTVTKGTTYLVGDFFNVVQDTEQPILDFAGITQPYWIWKDDTFTAPMPIATDNIDGDITSNIQITSTVNPTVAGNYTVDYNVCDAHNNCTTASLNVEVKETMATVNMTGKYAILFYYKDFSQVTSLNAICDSIDLSGNCFVQTFNYTGRWKYSKILLSNLDTLLYENGGIYAPLDPASTDYKNYNNINIGHLTDNFNIGAEYGVLMYNESGANTVKLKYNQKYFDYKIYNSANDTDQKNIDYVNIGGTPTNTTDITPPYTELEDPAQQGNQDAGGLFSSFTTNTYGLTAIISQPLILINQLTSKTCQPLIIPLPYMDNKSITLPCMTDVYEENLGSMYDLYQVITFGIVAYWVIVKMLNMIKDFKNPDHDEIEVLDL
jgi:hypothetical protein